MMSGPRKKAPKTIAVIDPDRCFGAFACSICQAACPVAGCIVEEPDRDGRMVCAVRADLCIGCGLCVTLGNPDRAAAARVRLPGRLRRHQHDAVRRGREDPDSEKRRPLRALRALRLELQRSTSRLPPPARSATAAVIDARGDERRRLAQRRQRHARFDPQSIQHVDRSSVARLPAAPGAYGQPPRPPADASNVVMPNGSAASTLASAVPRVS